jgi:hypothetical protein
MTALAFAALYALGAVLMGRRFHVLTALELSDEPVATPPARHASLAVLVLWPLAVAVLVGAEAWVRVTGRVAR